MTVGTPAYKKGRKQGDCASCAMRRATVVRHGLRLCEKCARPRKAKR